MLAFAGRLLLVALLACGLALGSAGAYGYDPESKTVAAHIAAPPTTTTLPATLRTVALQARSSSRAAVGSAAARGSFLATKGAEEAGTPIYRGVARDHPGYDDALQGTAHPRNPSGATSAEAHNAGATADSPFTSWTHSRAVAERYAGENGAILGLRTGRPGPGWSFEWSPDIWHEQEVLIRGTVRGARVHRP